MAWYYYYGTAADNSFDLTTNYYYPSYYTNLYALGYANSDTLSGGAYNDYLDGGAGNDYLYGRGGDDYIDGGTGNDYIDGGAGYDTLYGGANNDYIDGGTGYDAMYGGTGNDTYVVDSAYDAVYEYAGGGTNDWVYSSVSYSLGSNVENLYVYGTAYSGYGNSLDNYIYGNTYDNYLSGGAGNDTMYAGAGNDYIDGGTGYDAMYGGTGNDYYVVDSAYDTVSEYAGEGTNDWVYSSVSYSLGSNVENLYLMGTAYYGYGNSLDNYIYGNSSSNYLDGGTGNDAMYGGSGNDYYVVDSAYDTVSEYAGEGTNDWVYSSVSYSLGSNVENLYLTGTAYSGYGNSLDNYIYGNSSSNYLDGGAGNDTMYAGAGNDYIDGGTGYDAMYGGTGNDYYVVDSTYDTVYEYASEGTSDWVYSSVSYSLGSNVENLYVYGTAYSGVGNSLDNVIYGNTYDNYLDGGTGNDAMYGGSGNDYYVVDSAYDTVYEYAGEGTNDWVYSSVSYSLGSNVENLYLMGTAYYGYGNSLDNDIYGNSSSNYLYGGTGDDYIYCGTGNDTVIGGYGNDIVNGYGGGTTEVDYLYGGTGGYNYGYADADTYVLGDAYGAYYQDTSSYDYSCGVVMDYSYSEGDKIQLYGSSSNYAVGYGNYGGTSATDTYLYSYSASAGYDLVGIVQDATTLNISYV